MSSDSLPQAVRGVVTFPRALPLRAKGPTDSAGQKAHTTRGSTQLTFEEKFILISLLINLSTTTLANLVQFF